MNTVVRACVAVALVALAAPAWAGEPATGERSRELRFEMAVAGPGEGPFGHVVMMHAEESFETKVVRGAPYQAEAVHEFVQALADGNRIVRRDSSTVARDGEGRTRREHGLAAIGPMLAGAPDHRAIFIHDPVAGVSWVLEPQEKIARKLTRPRVAAGPPALAGGKPPEVDRIVIRRPGGQPREHMAFGTARLPKPETESLGTNTIEGVEANGTRTTVTIPAGEMGNEKPLAIVTERWYSPELQAIVLSRHTDPRMGETTFRLTEISRGEPERSLFEVPSDYTVKEGGAGAHVKIRRHIDPTQR